MIFATVGTQLPFDRLIRSLDIWSMNQSASPCFAQIGANGRPPKYLPFSATLSPPQFAKHIAKCKAIVSHAGMGTILTALQYGKPIIVMLRLVKYGEHRNDHQLATVENIGNRHGIYIARDEIELVALLNKVSHLAGNRKCSRSAEPALIQAVDTFIHVGEGQVPHE